MGCVVCRGSLAAALCATALSTPSVRASGGRSVLVETLPQASAIWIGGRGNWSDPSHWYVPSAVIGDLFNIFIDHNNQSNSLVNLDVNALALSLSIDPGDQLNILNGRSLEMVSSTTGSTINNSGNIVIYGGLGGARLILGTSTSIGGSGQLRLVDPQFSVIVGSHGIEQLVNTDHTISGSGRLGQDSLSLVNAGLIDANVFESTLTIDPNLSGCTNAGTMRASLGGRLRLVDGSFFNSNGTIAALDGSRVILENASVIGGTLAASGSGLFSVVAPSSLRDVRLTSVMELGPVALTLAGHISHSNTMYVLAGESLATPPISEIWIPAGEVLLDGRGTIEMNLCRTSSGSSALGGRLVQGADHSIKGEGWLGSDTVAIVNHGLIQADHPYPMWIDPKDSEPFVNDGQIRSTGAGGMVITDAQFLNNGLLEVTSGSKITLTASTVVLNLSGGTLNGGTWRVVSETGPANLYFSTGAIAENHADITLSGPSSNFSAVNGMFANSGRLALRDRRSFATTGAFFDNSGTIDLASECTFTASNLFTQQPAGRLIVEVGAPIITVDDSTNGLIVMGQAILGGTLEVRLAPDAHLVEGQVYSIVQANQVSGSFARVIVPAGLSLTTGGGGTVINVVVTSVCPADIDHSSVVDIDDLVSLITQWGMCVSGPATCTGDLDGNAQVDIDDLVMLIASWGACPHG